VTTQGKKRHRLVLTLRNLTDFITLHTPTEDIVITTRIHQSRIRVGIEATDAVSVTRHTEKKEEP
jgi:hypothetical protein